MLWRKGAPRVYRGSVLHALHVKRHVCCINSCSTTDTVMLLLHIHYGRKYYPCIRMPLHVLIGTRLAKKFLITKDHNGSLLTLAPIPNSKKPSHIFKSISVRLIIMSHFYLTVLSGLFSLSKYMLVYQPISPKFV